MTHIKYDRGDYDSSTKTLHKSTPLAPSNRGPDAWDVDPQVQIIELLVDIHHVLKKILDLQAPYHSGSQTVEVEPPAVILEKPDVKSVL